jgi:hypothetical protein
MKKRILTLLTVAALLVGMLAISVASAFAAPSSPCPGNNGGVRIEGVHSDFDPAYDRNGNGLICRYDRYDKNGFLLSTRYKDDREIV